VLESKRQQINHLLVVEDNKGKRTIPLEAATCSIGRDLTNSIVLYSQVVSRQHAILLRVTIPENTNYLFRIVDGNLQGKRSRNGLIINNRRCFSHDLRHGDVIVFGSDVSAKYYATANLSDINFLTSCKAEEVSAFLANLSSPLSKAVPSNSALENSKEAALVRLASFPELISNPILEIDLAGTITYLNPAAILQFPAIREDSLQHPIIAGVVSTVQNGKEKFFIREVEVANKVFEQFVQYIPESDLIRSYIVDITERKRTEAVLRESEAKNRALLNAIPDLMLRISKDGTYLDYMPAKDNDMSAIGSQLLGKNEYEVLPLEVAHQRMYYVQRALSTGEIQIFEYQLPLNGSNRDYEARIVVSGEDEVLAIVRDITERKQAEADTRNALEKEKQLVELKSRFVSMTSHEFRTPLTTILSSAELLEDYIDKWPQEKNLQHLRRIQANVKHMAQLLNSVLLIGKAEAGKLECNPAPLDVVEFCCELVDEMQITTHSHIITFKPQCEYTNVNLDEKLLRHILINLLSNAIKYSPRGGTVHFDLVCEQQQAIFRVQDRGIGIPKVEQAQLFDSFHRATNVGNIPGTGLGLAIVKKSVDLHGGTITVESEVGVGTIFTVTLPLNK
jgi:signal transduction histidine kinase/pSer/pThr/pTyr-binding forkhead associated (FHA) protein